MAQLYAICVLVFKSLPSGRQPLTLSAGFLVRNITEATTCTKSRKWSHIYAILPTFIHGHEN